VPVKTEQAASTPEAAAMQLRGATTRAAQTWPYRPGSTVFVFDRPAPDRDQISYAQKAAIETLDEALPGSDLCRHRTTSGKTQQPA